MYPCKECSFVGTQNNALKKHVTTNHKRTQFSCDHCPYVTHMKGSFNRHLQIHEGPQYACHICDKKLSEQITLRKHIVSNHEKKKIFPCDSCQSVFDTSEQLKTHQDTHLVCPICDKIFSRKGNVNQHLKTTHSTERDFECTECDQKFTRAWSLKQHVITHSIIKPFQCQVCDKSFKSKGDLKEHQKRENARQCNICGVPFGFKSQMKKHKEEKH